MPKGITDDEIMQRMGLTDTEVRDLQAKFCELAKTLDAPQREVLKQSTPSVEAAVQTLGPDVTPERLTQFLRERAPHDAVMVMSFNGVVRPPSGHHGHHH